MRQKQLSRLFFLVAGAMTASVAQEPDGDAWYYERIAVQEPPVMETGRVEESWQDAWNPFVRKLRRQISARLEEESRLPRLRFELQGDRSNKFALFRCVERKGEFAITLQWDDPVPIDDLFLLPTRIPQADGTIRTLGFPLRSRIEWSGDGPADRGLRSVPVPERSVDEADGFPVRVQLEGIKTREIRWVIDEPYAPFGIGYLALSELFVLSGNTNVAPEASLSWSESFLPDRSMAPGFLKDEKTPLGLPLIREETSVLGYHSEIKELTESDEEWIELSWQQAQEVTSIRLIPSQQRVLPHTETFGFPLAHRTEFFRDGTRLGSRSFRYAIDPGQNVVTVPGIAGERVDRVRWIATELWQRRDSRFLSLAEFEVLNRKGENLAPEATLKVSSAGIQNAIWNLESLTDGLASEGKLISSGEWLRGLDEAKHLREKRLADSEELKRVIRNTNRILFAGLLVLPGLIAIVFMVSSRKVRKRARSESLELRKQLASDLHDELGGNLGSIVLLAEQARETQGQDSVTSDDLSRVVELAKDSRNQLRTILEVGDASKALPLDSDGFVQRLRLTIRDFFGEEHGYFTVPDDDGRTIELLSGKQRGEILLFCKEALHNLTQHSDASRVLVQVEPVSEGVTLTMEDDSTIPLSENGTLISKSLRRRAQRLAEEVTIERLSVDKGNLLRLWIQTKSIE